MVTHIVLELRHMLLGCGFLRERPGQHEFGLEYRPSAVHNAVQRGRHPADHRMPHPALDVLDDFSGRPFVPAPIEGLGRRAELDDEVV